MAEDTERRKHVDHNEVQARPAVIRAGVGDREITHIGRVVSITDHTLVVEVDDAAIALALSLAPSVEVDVDDGIALQTIVAEPGSRADDNPTSRRVELVRRDQS